VRVSAGLVDTIATNHGGKQIFIAESATKLIGDLSCSAVGHVAYTAMKRFSHGLLEL
jgi:hypothetical protein